MLIASSFVDYILSFCDLQIKLHLHFVLYESFIDLLYLFFFTVEVEIDAWCSEMLPVAATGPDQIMDDVKDFPFAGTLGTKFKPIFLVVSIRSFQELHL